MITPQEKAEELIEKFSKYANYWDCWNDEPIGENNGALAAIECVSQIIEAINNMEDPSVFIKGECENYIDYWMEVRKELEKI